VYKTQYYAEYGVGNENGHSRGRQSTASRYPIVRTRAIFFGPLDISLCLHSSFAMQGK